MLDDQNISKYKPKVVAREFGLLPQTSLAPEGIRVVDLVARGRAPYQSLIQQWRKSEVKSDGVVFLPFVETSSVMASGTGTCLVL